MKDAGYWRALERGWAAYGVGDLEGVIEGMRRLAEDMVAAGAVVRLPMGLLEVDHLLEACGDRIAREGGVRGEVRAGEELVLASRIYADGGHTGLIGDIVRARGVGVSMRMVLSQREAGFQPPEEAAWRRTGLDVECLLLAPAGPSIDRVKWILEKVGEAPPQRVYLLHHPADVEAVVVAAALAKAYGSALWLLHHVDMTPAAGLYLTGVRMVDLTPRATAFSRYALGLDSEWLPLTCVDPAYQKRQFLQRGKVTTGLSGTSWKIFSAKKPGYRYEDLLPLIMRATGGEHWHFGELKDDVRRMIEGRLEAAGVDARKFHYVKHVPGLAAAVGDAGVDVMLNTFPLPGARTSVECMAAGIPMMWHSMHASVDPLWVQMAYPGAVIWRHPADLIDHLRRVDVDWCEDQSVKARRHWETAHHPRHWQAMFSDGDGRGQALPAEYDRGFVDRWMQLHLLAGQIDRAMIGAVADGGQEVVGRRSWWSRLAGRWFGG